MIMVSMNIEKIAQTIIKYGFVVTPQLNGVINIRALDTTITYENIWEYLKVLFPYLDEDYVTFG